MTDEQLEQGIEAITAMLEAKSGDLAKVVEGEVIPEQQRALPAPAKPKRKRKRIARKVRKTDGNMDVSMGKDGAVADS